MIRLGRKVDLCVWLGFVAAVVSAPRFATAQSASAGEPEIRVFPAKPPMQLFQAQAARGGDFVANTPDCSPEGSTYSVHHLVGADTNNDGFVECFPIFDRTEPPPGEPDDIVTFDGVPEDIRTDVLGTIPNVTETIFDNGDKTTRSKYKAVRR